MISPVTILTGGSGAFPDRLAPPVSSAIARFREALALHENQTPETASAPHVDSSLATRLSSLVQASPAASAPSPCPPPVTRETLASAASAALAQAEAAFAPAPLPNSSFVIRHSSLAEAAPAASAPAIPMPSSDSPFATPPSVEAALARTPAAPAPTGGSGVSPGRLEVSASTIARFREVLALHEDIQKDFAASATSLSVAATPILAAPVAPPAREAGSVPEASASGATRETLAAAASSVLAQASALESSTASLAAAVPPPTRETLAAAASAALAQSAAFTDSANTLVALAQPIANAAIPHAESPEAPVAPIVPHAESAKFAEGQTAPVIPHAEVPAATREAGSVPEASASGFTREFLAAAASSALAQMETLARSTAAFQTAAAPVLNAVSPETLAPEQVDALAPTQTFTSTDGTAIPYRLYQPSSPSEAAPPAALPLVLFLHGAGTHGDDGAALANNISFRSILGWIKTHEPAIVLAPQCPADEQWVDTPWGDVKHTYSPVPPPHTAAALELLDKTLASLPVDRSRILVCGNSMGGYATWDLLVRRPGLFAAAIPVCGGGVPELAAESSRDVSVWTFHGDADPTVPVENTRAMVDALRSDPARTAEIRYREYPGVSHDSWTATFSDPEVLTWFFDQHRPRPATAAQATQPQPSLSPHPSSLPAASAPEDDPTKAAAAIQAAPLPVPPQVDSSLVTRHSSLTEAATPASVVRAAFEPAVEAVAEAIQISPDLSTKGEGEIRIQLKPAVLDGSAVLISVSGNDMSIVFTPATPDVAALLQAHTPELATLLAERVPAWRATVSVRGETGRRSKE